jgi:predicted RNA binding protein YcfA (HicA-like mRNA interferase family)
MPDSRRTVVPVHAGEIIGVGLMKTILDDTEITAEQFLELE